MSAAVDRFGPGEYLIWQGRPRWTGLARDVLHVRPIALYLAVVWIAIAASNRSSGLSPMETLAAGAPLALVSALVVGACLAFAWGLARTTRYTLTNQRCIMHFGLALTATLSLPLRQIASVAIAERSDGTGDLPMQLKPGKRLGYIKLWPHVPAVAYVAPGADASLRARCRAGWRVAEPGGRRSQRGPALLASTRRPRRRGTGRCRGAGARLRRSDALVQQMSECTGIRWAKRIEIDHLVCC